MEVSLPQTMLQKLLDLLKLESLKFCLKIHVHVIRSIRCQVNIDYHNQHESAALIGLFHKTASSVLQSVESYPNYRKLTQRGVEGYLSSLQRRVEDSVKTEKEGIMLTLRDAAATDPFIHKLNMSCHSYSTPTLCCHT